MRHIAQRCRWMAVFGTLVAPFAVSAPALADTMAITYSAARQVAPNFSSICLNATICDYGLENFSGWSGASTFSSSFNDAGTGTYFAPTGVTFSGTYSAGTGTTTGTGGAWISVAQNQYGGVSGQHYPELYGPTNGAVKNQGTANPTNYNLALTATGVPGVNYFGIWISALDAYNDLKVYDGNTLVAEFDSSVLLADLGNCSRPSQNAYCGNPTPQFNGQDSGELFAYVNVFDLTGYITNVEFFNAGNTGFESSNDAVGYVNPIHVVGTSVTSIPEPSSLTLFSMSLFALQRAHKRRSHVTAAA